MEQRKHPRLKGYDYGQDGVYFITICTDKKKKVLSEIVGRGLAPAAVHLLPAGKIVSEELENLRTRFPILSIDRAAIMPNHIHLLLRVGGGEPPRHNPPPRAPPPRTSPWGRGAGTPPPYARYPIHNRYRYDPGIEVYYHPAVERSPGDGGAKALATLLLRPHHPG